MRIFKKIMPLRSLLNEKRSNNIKIGLVPTMGALHAGHVSLIRKCASVCDLTVVSIFVNPAQFNNPDDFKKYPITTQKDQELLEKEEVDILFSPDQGEIYPNQSKLEFDLGKIGSIMEGEFRPGHFSGVCLIVSKLFNIVQPHTAFFGQKDLQQVAIIKRLNLELSFGIDIYTVDTVRELDGLAMSSRNSRLSKRDRKLAPVLFQSMSLLKEKLTAGESIDASLIAAKNNVLEKDPSIHLEYLEIVDSIELERVENIEEHQEISICVAAHFGDVRLIDNLFLFSR